MIDWARVTELRSEIGEDDFAEVIEMFLEEANEVAVTLAQAPDASQMEAALHFLKGSALNLGFRDLARLCQDGEKAATSGQAMAVDLQAVIDCYETSKLQFFGGLASASAA